MHSLQLCENVVNLFTCLRHVGRFWIVGNVTDCASLVFKIHHPLPHLDSKMSSFTCRRGTRGCTGYGIDARQVLLIKVLIDGSIACFCRVQTSQFSLFRHETHDLEACLTISQFVAESHDYQPVFTLDKPTVRHSDSCLCRLIRSVSLDIADSLN